LLITSQFTNELASNGSTRSLMMESESRVWANLSGRINVFQRTTRSTEGKPVKAIDALSSFIDTLNEHSHFRYPIVNLPDRCSVHLELVGRDDQMPVPRAVRHLLSKVGNQRNFVDSRRSTTWYVTSQNTIWELFAFGSVFFINRLQLAAGVPKLLHTFFNDDIEIVGVTIPKSSTVIKLNHWISELPADGRTNHLLNYCLGKVKVDGNLHRLCS